MIVITMMMIIVTTTIIMIIINIYICNNIYIYNTIYIYGYILHILLTYTHPLFLLFWYPCGWSWASTISHRLEGVDFYENLIKLLQKIQHQKATFCCTMATAECPSFPETQMVEDSCDHSWSNSLKKQWLLGRWFDARPMKVIFHPGRTPSTYSGVGW